jgi:hypothetical protein
MLKEWKQGCVGLKTNMISLRKKKMTINVIYIRLDFACNIMFHCATHDHAINIKISKLNVF